MSEPKQFKRSAEDRVLLGVCSGFAKFINTDPGLIRALYVLLTIFTGFIPGFIAYFAIAIVIPEEEGKGNS